MECLNIAFPKGRLKNSCIRLFDGVGINCKELKYETRKMIMYDNINNIKFFMVKPSDVPIYIKLGLADIGIVGKDVLLEYDKDIFREVDLGFATCRIVVAGTKEKEKNFDSLDFIRIATKYPCITRRYFGQIGKKHIKIVKLNGSVEIAPLIGLSDGIVDIVETGKTLTDNDLAIYHVISDISARLIVHKKNINNGHKRIEELIQKIEKTIVNKETFK